MRVIRVRRSAWLYFFGNRPMRPIFSQPREDLGACGLDSPKDATGCLNRILGFLGRDVDVTAIVSRGAEPKEKGIVLS